MSKIRLTESQLHRLISESVKKVLRENLTEMGMIDKKTGEEYNYSDQNVNTPGASTHDWRYNGSDSIDRYMWYLKKLAQKLQKENEIKNKYSELLSTGKITPLQIPNKYQLVGVLNGKKYPNPVRQDGWPTADFIEEVIDDEIRKTDYEDQGPCLEDDYTLSEFYSRITDLRYIQMLEYENNHPHGYYRGNF